MVTFLLCWISLLLGVMLGYGLCIVLKGFAAHSVREIYCYPERASQVPTPTYWEICMN